MKYKIKFVTDQHLLGYDGMNYYAAQELGFDKDIALDEIFVNQNLSVEEQATTVLHEIVEAKNMFKGKKYHEAHAIAYAAESDPKCNDMWKELFVKILKSYQTEFVYHGSIKIV